MPKFVVYRGRDAWVIEKAIIEAETAEEAEEKASWHEEANKLDWVETDDVRKFDDTVIMETEAHIFEDTEGTNEKE